MQQVELGRTGLRVGVAGLGCGGFSRLGLSQGGSEAAAVALIRTAIDLGVTLIDTAAIYGTEPVVGRALAELRREDVVIATKASAGPEGFSAETVLASLENSLRVLGTDHIDMFQVHAVAPAQYDTVRDRVVPALLRAREQGKFRFLGITETSPRDPEQHMLHRALAETIDGKPLWQTAMFAFHMLHQAARAQVFPLTRAHGIGSLLMFVVRGIFASPARLAPAIADLASRGLIPAELGTRENALDFLIHAAGADSLTDAAYRYARHEPGAEVILFGTGSAAHLRANIASINAPPLPAADRALLARLFSHLRGVGLKAPPAP
ncbi:MAG: aldo/keto reductase [Rhodospirillales bacterium]|nr:aldo/keto reductase [Rhodospirillales bacterium]